MTHSGLPTFSLDSNCIYDIEDARPKAAFVNQILQAHKDGKVSVALAAISASERQRSGTPFERFDDFKARVRNLGLGGLDLLMPMAYLGVTYWNNSEWADASGSDVALEREIHEILFPNIQFLWEDYCRENGLDPVADFHSVAARKWKNAKCDVQAFWSHGSRHRDVFVTSDENFHKATKKPKLIALVGGRIETPESAAALLRALSPT